MKQVTSKIKFFVFFLGGLQSWTFVSGVVIEIARFGRIGMYVSEMRKNGECNL